MILATRPMARLICCGFLAKSSRQTAAGQADKGSPPKSSRCRESSVTQIHDQVADLKADRSYPPKTPPSSAMPIPASGLTPTLTPKRSPSSATPFPLTGPAACRPRIPSTTAGRSGYSSVFMSGDWRTARILPSTGAPLTRPSWLTNKWSTVRVSAAGRW